MFANSFLPVRKVHFNLDFQFIVQNANNCLVVTVRLRLVYLLLWVAGFQDGFDKVTNLVSVKQICSGLFISL